jgi:hypothetical protein
MLKTPHLRSIIALTLGLAVVVNLATATHMNSIFVLLCLALFALGLLHIYFTLISAIRASRKPAYLKIRRQVSGPRLDKSFIRQSNPDSSRN